MDEIRIGIVGCAGRMGGALVRQIAATEGCALAGGCERPGHPALGADLGAHAGLEPGAHVISDDPRALFDRSHVVIDFTSPDATVRHAQIAAATGVALVTGTTGLKPEQMAALEQAARSTAIVWAANMSLGVNLLIALTRHVASVLDEDFDIEVLEMHHRHKVDAPSGTALALGRAAAQGRGRPLEETADRGRDGITGERRRGDIGFAVLRGGNVVGDHSVIFAAENERIELGHQAGNRSIFARGAVRAARWAATAKPGLHGMDEVLGLKL
ncbi:MAG: 4-hydroxy-tetrahydrodipicolinate reductase [Sphingomonadales bacterium]